METSTTFKYDRLDDDFLNISYIYIGMYLYYNMYCDKDCFFLHFIFPRNFCRFCNLYINRIRRKEKKEKHNKLGI